MVKGLLKSVNPSGVQNRCDPDILSKMTVKCSDESQFKLQRQEVVWFLGGDGAVRAFSCKEKSNNGEGKKREQQIWETEGTSGRLNVCSWRGGCDVTCRVCVLLSGSALRAATADTTATPTSPAPLTQRISGGCSTTAGTSSRECTYGSTNSCDGRPTPSAFCVLFCFFFLHHSATLTNLSSCSSLTLHPTSPEETHPDRPSCRGLWSTTEVCQILFLFLTS